MNKQELLALCERFGIVANASMTIDELKALIAGYVPPVPTVATQQGALTPSAPKTAESIFHKMTASNMHTFTGYKVMFIAGAKHGLKLVLRKGDDTVSVYVYKESVEYSGVKDGDVVTILAELTVKDSKQYWNATALSKHE
jgi:hypothetical protein